MTLMLETALAVGQNAINYALSLDDEVQAALMQLQNRCVAVHLTHVDQTIYMLIDQKQIFLSKHAQAQVDLTIKASLKDFWQLSQNANTPTQHIEVHGNMHIAQQLSKIAHDFSPDWEEALSQVTGDVVGHTLAQTIRQAHACAKLLTTNMLHNTADYVVNEDPLIAAKYSIDSFIEEVQTLRTRCDRLTVRVNLLERT